MRQIIETWGINNKIDFYLLNSVNEAHLSFVVLSKGRNVVEHFAHIHNMRLLWLKEAMPELISTDEKIENEYITKKILV